MLRLIGKLPFLSLQMSTLAYALDFPWRPPPSFYSSQGRITSFEDHNDFLLQHLLSAVPALTTLEVIFLSFNSQSNVPSKIDCPGLYCRWKPFSFFISPNLTIGEASMKRIIVQHQTNRPLWRKLVLRPLKFLAPSWRHLRLLRELKLLRPTRPRVRRPAA
jgi:hypothetical protein